MDSRKNSWLETPAQRRYWPGHRLVPLLDRLQFQLLPDIQENERRRRAILDLEQLPYCLGAVTYSLLELVSTQNITVTLDLANPGGQSGLHVLRPYERDRMAFLVDSVLESLRRAQNAVTPYLNRARRVSLGTSMRKAVEVLEKDSSLLAGPARDLVLEYWREHGLRLKRYRDLSQHHTIVSSDARTFVSGDGRPMIYLVLPNNPEEKRPSLLRYEEPFVHALPYLYDEVLALLRLVNLLCDHLIDKSLPSRASLGQALKGPIVLGQAPQGHPIITADMVIHNFKKRIRGLPDPIDLSIHPTRY